MIFSVLLVLWVSSIQPESFVIQSAIDSAKIIGLPRLRTMDRLFAKNIWIGELEDEIKRIPYSRLKFLKDYINLKKDS